MPSLWYVHVGAVILLILRAPIEAAHGKGLQRLLRHETLDRYVGPRWNVPGPARRRYMHSPAHKWGPVQEDTQHEKTATLLATTLFIPTQAPRPARTLKAIFVTRSAKPVAAQTARSPRSTRTRLPLSLAAPSPSLCRLETWPALRRPFWVDGAAAGGLRFRPVAWAWRAKARCHQTKLHPECAQREEFVILRSIRFPTCPIDYYRKSKMPC